VHCMRNAEELNIEAIRFLAGNEERMGNRPPGADASEKETLEQDRQHANLQSGI
jgi:hypothetical protein